MDTKLKIIAELEKKHVGIHLREISRLVESGLPNIKRFLDIFEKERVVKKEKDANLVKYKLKRHPKTLAYLKQVHVERFLMIPKRIQNAIEDFLSELEVPPIITLIFGSYSKGDYVRDSDIDILLVFQNIKNEGDIENIAKRISMRTNTKISPVYLKYRNFERNFMNKNHDFSKEIRQDVIVITGIEIYYKLLWSFLE